MGKSRKTNGDWDELAFKLSTVFRPSTPVNRQDLFSGRRTQIRKVCDAINQPGLHAILYGERGVGKTSCANMLFPQLHSQGHLLIPLVNCMNADSFGSVWKRVFEEINIKVDDDNMELPEKAAQIVNAYTEPYGDGITPDVVRRLLHELAKQFLVVIVLDEFDTVEDPVTRRAIADMIKFLSDRNVPATVVLIGVADDISALLEDHRSVERCMSQIPIPRMSRNEIEDVVTTGLLEFEMRIENAALHEISRIARGLPQYAHLFGLHAGRAAIDRKSTDVAGGDMTVAVEAALEDVQASTKSDYVKATTSARNDALFRHVLLAASMAESDELGFFYPKQVCRPLSRIMGKPTKIDQFNRHLSQFCTAVRGSVLTKDAKTNRPRYRFTNPMLQPYVLIRGLADKLVDENDLRETRDPDDPQGRLF